MPSDLQHVKPVYESFKGWGHSAGIRDFSALPKAAQDYIQALQEYVGVEISLISTSPERDDVILQQW